MSRATLRSRGNCAPVVDVLEPRRLFATDFVLQWNTVALDAVRNDFTPSVVATPDQPGPSGTARALAIVQAAVFDAVNSIDGSYTPYLVSLPGYRDASIGAAVSQAAHDTLVALYPHQRSSFDAALRSSLALIPNGRAEQQGTSLGSRVANVILRVRQHDGSSYSEPYSEPVKPGVFQTFPGEPQPYGDSWGSVTPFTLKSGSQFRAPPPPSLTSPQYAAAYNEAKAYGGDGVTTPTRRTPDQTNAGIYWAYDGTPGIGTPPRLYNQITQVIAKQEGNTQVENARLFALTNLAMADAGIVCWDTKYTYDFWRPIRGIRQVGPNGQNLDDRNPATTADPTWTPLGSPYTNGDPGDANFTPNFPAYSSGHATFGAALFRTLALFYGTDHISFTFTSDELNGVSQNADGTTRPLAPRTFTSFSQAAEENAQSRIYLGVHWSFDKTAGLRQGTQVADYAFTHVLTPLRPHPGPGDWGHDGHQDSHDDHDGPPLSRTPATTPSSPSPSSTSASPSDLLTATDDDPNSVLT